MGFDVGMVILGLLCVLGLPLILVAAVYFGARGLRARPRTNGVDDARALLDRRLAEGVIDLDEYYERESALRTTH